MDEDEEQLARFNPRETTGPNEIPAWVPRDFAHFLSGPLCAVFNSSIGEGGFVPDLYKTACVTPLPKREPPNQIKSDLRHVSLVPIASKVLKHIVCKWAREAIAPDVHPRQHGAVKGSSTTHALVAMLHLIQRNLDTTGRYVRMLLLDYSEDFDLVNHSILLGKMQRADIPACLVNWCAAFLISRQQHVRIGSALSDQVTLYTRRHTAKHTAGPTGIRHSLGILRHPPDRWKTSCSLMTAAAATRPAAIGTVTSS